MIADQPTIDAIVDAVHVLAGRGSDWQSVESLSAELEKISPAAAARLNEPTFAAAVVRGVQPAGRYVDAMEAPFPLVDEFENELEAMFGATRAAEIRATRRVTSSERALMKKRWANAYLDDGFGMPFWIIELQKGDERSAWVLVCDDDEDGTAVWIVAATKPKLIRFLTIYGFVDKPLPLEERSASWPRPAAE